MIDLGKYAITSDANGYSVGEKRFRTSDDKKGAYKKGDSYVFALGIYSANVHGCARGLIRRLQRETVQERDMTLHEAAEAFEAVEKAVYAWAKIDGD
jgi:hypothetical protein